MQGDDAGTTSMPAASGPEILVGLSIEPAAQVEAQLAALKAPSTNPINAATSSAMVKAATHSAQPSSTTGCPVPTKILAKRIIKHELDFLASFDNNMIPLKSFTDWWTKFERKVDLDPTFLEREDG